MDKKEIEKDNIELRSEKVRNLIGEIPPSLVRWGTVVIVLIFLLLLTALCLLPYPYSNGETIIKHFFS
ncbi:MAG: hypothetical protein J1F38_04445 [Muribaculaceae bacterium]|nr:hypothetical protein [Muribaculaceae bacterium]